MSDLSQHIMIVAGEASGDMHAAHLVEALKARAPHLRFSGVGGEKMRAAGVELYEDLARLAVVGFVEVIKHYGEIRRIFHIVLSKAEALRPSAVILVDYPGFNLRLAAELKKRGIRVIYYISPQVWAWKENRVELIRRDVDRMLVIFKFEQELYARHGIEVEFVGHPLVDMLKDHIAAAQAHPARAVTADSDVRIGLLPGSRRKEVDSLLPPMLAAAALIRAKVPKAEFVLMKAPTIGRDILEAHLKASSVPVRIIDENIYAGIAGTDLCLVASGTATLETAILERPMAVIYKTSFLTWVLAKLLIKIPYIGLVNVVAGRKIMPECLQFEATGEKISETLLAIIADAKRQEDMRGELRKLRGILGGPGASGRAAEAVIRLLHSPLR